MQSLETDIGFKFYKENGMSKAGRTIQVWSFYLFGLGLILLFAPNFLLGLFGFPTTDDVWIRIVGVLALVLAYYYYNAAKSEMTELFRWSIHGRMPIIVIFIIFVLLKRGYSPEDIEKICSGTLFRVWNKVIEVSSASM